VLIYSDRWTDGWTRHDETNRCILRLNANAPKILTLISDFISPFYREQYKREVHRCFSILTKSRFSRRYFVKGHTDGRTDRHDEAKFYVIYTVHVLKSIYHPTYALCNTPFNLFQHFKISLIPKLRNRTWIGILPYIPVL
jgi:hypothetical protein